MNTHDDTRPNPDDLLASIKEEEEKGSKGKLKIFFGMCAGVGKTYTMLQTARTDRTKGIDVVAGIVETHSRKETNDLLEGLEVIPGKVIDYKGTVLREMDLDGVLARHPRIVLVDELAHTNAPGCRHLKRYQDVLEILDNGIDVYTTINVQHLESRTDTVSQITGIVIRETIPDEIFEKADEVELVDITPEELLNRFSEGKVYAPERSKEALVHFFRKGNITALREMSLRIVADRVDKQLRDYMQRKRIPGPWKSGLRLMVVIGPSKQTLKLIRWAKNLSYTMGASLLALYVESPQRLSPAHEEQLNRNIQLVKQLGAEFISTSGNDLVKAILAVAAKENITHIIVGKPRQRNIFSLLRLGSFIQRLIRYSGNIDVYVLGADVASDNQYMKYISLPTLTSHLNQYILSFAIISLTTAVIFPFSGHIGYQSVSFLLLFVVTILATFLGIGPILLASTMSALVWDFFFIQPRFTFHVERTEDMLMLGMFFFIALLNGVLTSRVRRQERLTRDREERTNALFQLTRDLSQATGIPEVIDVARKSIRKYFSFDSCFYLSESLNELKGHPEGPDTASLSSNDFSIASWVYRHARKAGRFTDTLPSTMFTFYPLPGYSIKPGIVAVKQKNRLAGVKENFWDTSLNQISNALERKLLDDLARKAQMLDESDRLYKALFNSISHELRIPVSAIMGASEVLSSPRCNNENRQALYEEISTASERLSRLIDNLLNMSRLESGHILAHLDWCDVHDLVNRVAGNLKKELLPFHLITVIPENMPLVKIDFGLMEQILHNLLYNATQYAPPGSNIRIKLFHDNGFMILQVMDRGPGFPEKDIPLIFNKFYRVKGSKAGGTGLGLSIVKGFTEAHGGTVTVENRQNGGARFTVRIPSPLPDISALI